MWKSCGCTVHFLCMIRHAKFFSHAYSANSAGTGMCTRFRTSLRLIGRVRCIHLCALPNLFSYATPVSIDVHRFEESIGGRSYLIEVKPVAHDRWRAYIVRLPGVPTALMPFYGPTPAEAARQLSNWLTRAHERVSKPGGSV